MPDPLPRVITPRSFSPNSKRLRREYEREISQHLRDLHEPTWGLAIFRTVFTAGSDARFALFLAKLRAYVDYAIDDDLRPNPFMNPSTDPPFDSSPNEEMKRRFVNDVIEDRALDGADTDAVRAAFTSWLVANGVDVDIHQLYARHRVCIMVDEAVLDAAVAAPGDPSLASDFDVFWVKVVEYLAPGEEEWQAWLKVGVANLYGFWFSVYGDQDVGGMFMEMVESGEEFYMG